MRSRSMRAIRVAEAESAARRDRARRRARRGACARTSPITRRSRGLFRRRVAALGPLTLLVNNASTLRAGRDRRARCGALRSPVRRQSARAAVPAAKPSPRRRREARTRRSSTSSISACSSSRRISSPTRWRRARCMPRPACWRRRWRRTCASTRSRPGPTVQSARQQPEDFARQAAAVPLGRGPSPQEIAAAVVYLARRAQRDRRDARGRRRPASRLADAGRERDRMSDVQSVRGRRLRQRGAGADHRRGRRRAVRGAGRERSRRRAGGDRARRGAVRLDRAVGRAHPGGGHALPGARAASRIRPKLFAADIARKAHGEADAKLVRAVARGRRADGRMAGGRPTRCRSRSSPISTIRAIRRIACTDCRAAPAPS